MYGNGAGTGLQTVTIQKQKVATTQPVLRLGLAASAAVVVGTAILAAVQFLSVAAAALAAATATLVSVWCVQQTKVCCSVRKLYKFY